MDENVRKVAVFADMHLPEREDTVKECVFDWALAEAARQDVDLLLGAGDMTSLGTLGAAKRLVSKMAETGIPFLNAPGNAERRTSHCRSDVAALLNPNMRCGNVIVLDNARQKLTEESKDFLRKVAASNAKDLLAVAHCPLTTMTVDEQVWLDEFVIDGVISCLVCGHKHQDYSDKHYQVIRGLDPDKAIGGPPALVIMEWIDNKWKRRDITCPLATPTGWPLEIRQGFLDHLGISISGNPLEDIVRATELRVPCIELRYGDGLVLMADQLAKPLENWRNAGGKNLSLHLPVISPDESLTGFSGESQLLEASRLAVTLGCDAATLHVPSTHPIGKMLGEYRSRLLEATSACLSPLVEAGITISVENMHLRRDEKIDSMRGYGYMPEECVSWIESLREVLAYDKIGFLLDIGHARNNGWFASRFNLSEWYAEMGGMLTGCHLHQVALLPNGKTANHSPLKELYGQYISLSSFLMAWRCGQLNHVPLYLEIRGESSIESLIELRRIMNAEC
jgi:Zn ribbon nucleic-acid-binding protein